LIVLVQLSDIHFGSPDNDKIASRVDEVRGAICSRFPKAEACFIVLSGDVSNTGSPDEYVIAEHFMTVLAAALKQEGFGVVEIISVPGNHDLNLRGETDTRQMLLESPESYIRKGVDVSGANYRAVISVQDDFFSFDKTLAGSAIPQENRIYYQRGYAVASRRILFHCFNTAWLSRRHEEQGKLFIPPEFLKSQTPSDIDLSVAILHHPYNWMDVDNQRAVKKFIEHQADVALTGHEHDQSISRLTRLKGHTIDYFAAPAFSDPKVPSNGFQLLGVDFERATQYMYVFDWDGARFNEADSGTWALRRNIQRSVDPLTIRDAYWDSLEDIGTKFSHPRCIPPQCTLKLRDLYVYPDLLQKQIDEAISGKGSPTKNIEGSKLKDLLREHRCLLIFGADEGGKSSLAKILFQDLVVDGLLPIQLSGADLKGFAEEKTRRRLSQKIIETYNSDSAEPYLQVESARRVLILDDFDSANAPPGRQKEILRWMHERFDYVAIFASDIFEIQDMSYPKEQNPFSRFERLSIRQFGRYHRHKLIEKWLLFGEEDPTRLLSLDKRLSQTDKTVSTLLGKNVLPHHPVTILTLLQLLESKEPVNTANGSYGYMYEVLMKSALAKIDPRTVDEKITYISSIGYQLFKAGTQVINEADLLETHLSYCERYDMSRDFSQMLGDLIRAEVLMAVPGGYRFKYPYEFYYSTAKYLQDNASSLRKELYQAADHIYGELNANILIFYVYLTKDEDLIRHIVHSAKQILAECKPCDLSGDVTFLNKLMKELPPPLQLEYSDTAERRDAHNRKVDVANEQEDSAIASAEHDSTNEQLKVFRTFAVALKTLQLLGQILRNFTGSLPGPLKLDITSECYALGMRTLSAVLKIPSEDIEGMRQYLGSLIAERTEITDKQELATKTDRAIVWLGQAAAFGAVKRISYAVGHGDLSNTYGRLLTRTPNTATRVIDATIKLDHFDRIPETELKKLSTDLEKNYFTYSVVRDLVADYLYLYSVDFQTMQKLGSMYKITVSKPKYLVNRAKK
jgi:UDP-2,3-diacylglucosamine pyrophosphatase LpxH